MNKMLMLSLSLVITLGAAGCKKDKAEGGGGGGGGGGGAAEAPKGPPVKMVELDASAAGEAFAGWKLQAPEGAAAKEEFGALSVSDGKGFQMEVNTGAVDIAGRKKEIAANDINKLKRYVTDTADAIVYESDVGMGPTQFHFLATSKVGEEPIYCENTKGPVYTQAQIEAMVTSCKSIKK